MKRREFLQVSASAISAPLVIKDVDAKKTEPKTGDQQEIMIYVDYQLNGRQYRDSKIINPGPLKTMAAICPIEITVFDAPPGMYYERKKYVIFPVDKKIIIDGSKYFGDEEVLWREAWIEYILPGTKKIFWRSKKEKGELSYNGKFTMECEELPSDMGMISFI